VCTRGCRFCAVTTGNPRGAYDPREPEHTGRTIAAMGLEYVVITMVDRDDMLDGGAAHVAETLRAIRTHSPEILIEALLGDFSGNLDDVATTVTEGRPDVFAHNVETVERLQRTVRDARCSMEKSLAVLRHAKAVSPETYTKSSIMVGLGETRDEVLETMRALRAVDVDVLTLGQYLRPTPKHHELVRYWTPEEFDALRDEGLAMGFKYVASGPLVRSSYRAAEAFLRGLLTKTTGPVESSAARPHRSLPVLP
jgi:lipoic acid synthetase